jgi:hypothetical protein
MHEYMHVVFVFIIFANGQVVTECPLLQLLHVQMNSHGYLIWYCFVVVV